MTDRPDQPVVQEIASPHSFGNRLVRLLWGWTYLVFFRTSPRNLHRWRNFVLRVYGARVHRTARVYPRARIWLPRNLIMHEFSCISDDVDVYCVEPVTIGAYSTVSQYTYLCGATHDFEDVRHPLIPKPITLGRRVWVAAEVFIAPGVSIGDGAVVGACSCVFKDLPGWTIYAGNPARGLRPRTLTPADFGDGSTDGRTESKEQGPGENGNEQSRGMVR